MNCIRMMLALFVAFVSITSVTTTASANDEGKTCHADSDCDHGEHCKDGHCHK